MSEGLFERLEDDARREVWAHMRRRRFARGEVLFHQGDPGDSLHLIVKGRVSVRTATPRGDRAILRVLGPDQVVGEFALVSPAPRAATVTALEPTETMTLDRATFADLRTKCPGVDDFLLVASVDDGELFVYQGDAHLFTDSSLPSYDEAATRQVLERVLVLLARV